MLTLYLAPSQNTEPLDLPAEQFGRPRADAGQWASCIRVVDPVESSTLALIELEDNEAAFSIAVVPFASRGGEPLLVVGSAKDTFLSPRACSSGFLRTYAFTDGGRGLDLVHVTEVDDIPTALIAFHGKLVAGVGKALRVYDIGKKKLLRKTENNVRPALAPFAASAHPHDPGLTPPASPLPSASTSRRPSPRSARKARA